MSPMNRSSGNEPMFPSAHTISKQADAILQRLRDLSAHIEPVSPPSSSEKATPSATTNTFTTNNMSPSLPTRPFITCHVLDTITGKPAPSIAVSLKLLSPSQLTTSYWTAVTNDDGRVTSWQSSSDIQDVVAQAKSQLGEGEQMIWSLTFETEAYFGKGKTFWPEVELRFAAERDEKHYHVPLLLGPWSYTTYRGS